MPTEIDWDSIAATGEDSAEFDWDSIARSGRASADDLRAELRSRQDASFGPSDFAREVKYGAWEGLGSLGQQAGGLLSFFGADDYGNRLSRGSGEFIGAVDRFADAVGGDDTPSQFTRYLSGQVVNQLPAMGVGLAATAATGGVAGLGVMTAASALQSTGATMSEASQGYEDQGLSREDAVRLARYPAAASGVLTGFLTRYGGGKGSGAEKLIIDLATGALKGAAARKIAKHIAVEGLKEGLFEEGPDELGQGFLAKLTYDPERTLQEIGLNAMEAAGMGTAMSLGIGAGNFARMGPRDTKENVVETARRSEVPGEARQRFMDSAGNVTDSITSNPSIQTRQTSGPNLTRNADGILVDEEGALYDDYGEKATRALTYRNGGWVQVGRTKTDASADSLGNSIQQGPTDSSQGSQNADTSDSESSDDIPFPGIDPEQERIGLARLREIMGEPDEAPVPLSQASTPQAAPTSKTRMVKVAAKILTTRGHTPEFANQFASQFVESQGSQFDSTGEAFREALLRAEQELGAAPVQTRYFYHEDPAHYEGMGLSVDEIAEEVQNSKIANAEKRAAAEKANTDALAKFKTFSPQPVAEVKGGDLNAQENQTQTQAEAPQASVLTPAAAAAAEPSPVPPVQEPEAVAAPAPPAPPVKDRFVVQAETDLANAKDLLKAAKRNMTAATKAFTSKSMSEKEYRFAQKNFDDGKRSVARAEKRLEKMEKEAKKKAQPAKPAKVSNYEHPYDVLTWLEGNGWKIKRFKEGQENDLAGPLRSGAKNAPRHFTDSGSAPDVVAQAYNDAHGADLTDGEFVELVSNAPRVRAGNRKAHYDTIREMDALSKESKQQDTFGRDAIAGVKRDKVQPVAADALSEGDRFKVKGEKFVVEKVTNRPDDETMVASVRVKDGPKYGTQTVHGDATIKADPRTLRSQDGKRKSTTDISFLPDEQGALGGPTEERGSLGVDELGMGANRYVVAQGRLSRRAESEGLIQFSRRMKLEYFNGLIEKSISEGNPIPEGVQSAIADLDKVQLDAFPKRDAEWKRLRHLERVDNPQNPYRDSDVAAAKAQIDKVPSGKRPLKELVYRGDTGQTRRTHIGISVTTNKGVAEAYGPITAYQLDASDALYFDKPVSRADFLKRGASPEIKTSENPTGQEILEATTKWLKQKGDASPPAVGEYLSGLGWQAYKMASQSFVFDAFALSNEKGAIGGQSGSTAPTARAQGIFDIRALIAQSNMSDDAKFVAQKILDVVEKNGLDPAALTLELSESLPGGRAGSIMGTLIRMIESADAKVLPHEVAHLLRKLMPAEVVAAIEQARLDNMPADAPKEVIDGTMTTQQFIDAKIDPKFYPFINLDEYLAHFFADKFAKEQLSKRDAGLMERIQTWLKEIWEAIKSKFRDPAAMDRIYRDMVAGKYKVTPETGLRVEQERGGLQTTKAGAENELAVARDAAAQIQSGEDFIAQAEPLVGILSKFNVASFPNALRHALRWNDLSAILGIGQRAAPNATLQSVTQQADPARQADLARMAGQQVVLTERRLDNAIADGTAAKIEFQSVPIQSRLKDMRAATILRMFNLQAFKDTRTAVQTALNQAVALLEAERGTDLSVATLEGQVRAMEGVAQSGVAMEQLLTDMTGVLMVSPEGQALLAGNGTPRDIAAFYRDIKRTANQPIQNDQLLSVASYMLNRMPDMRDKLIAAQWAQSPAVVAQVQGSMKGLMDRLKKNPAATIERMMVEREKRVASAVGADFLFFQVQKELSKDLESLFLRMKAGEIATAVKTDPDWLAYRQQTLRAQTSFDGKPIDPTRDFNASLTLPDGTTVGIGANRIVDSTRETKIAVKELGVAAAKIKAWLDDPANWNDTTYERRQLDLHTIETELGLLNLQSGHKTPFMIWSMSILNNTINQSGSRHSAAARVMAGKIDRAQDKVNGWLATASLRLANSQRAAMTAQGLFRLNEDSGEAAPIYESEVFNELAGSHQHTSGALQVGDTLLSGRTVTAADMAHLELSAQLDSDLIAIIQKYDRVIISDEGGLVPGQVNYRGPLKTRKNMLPRIPNAALANLPNIADAAKAWDDYANGEVLERDANGKPQKDANGKEIRGPKQTPAALAALNRAFSQMWPEFGKWFIAERHDDFSQKTVFDGPGGAFALIDGNIRQWKNSYPTFDSVIAELVTLTSGSTPDQVRGILLNEFGRIINKWHETVAADELRVKIEGGEPTSSFNTARGRALAPSVFYRIGWANTPALRSHAASATSVPVARFVDMLKIIQRELEAQLVQMESKIRSLKSQGVLLPSVAARNAKAMEQRNGHAFSDWRNLEGRIKMVKNSINDLMNAPVNRSDWDEAWMRLGGGVVGSMVANSATNARNTSSIYHVRAIRKSGQSEVMSWFLGMRFSQEQALRMAVSFARAMPKVSRAAIKGLAESIPAGIKDKSLKSFYTTLMKGVVHALGRNAIETIQGFEEMEAAGLMHIPDAQANFENRMADPTYAGWIPERKAVGLPRKMMQAGALLENTVLALSGAVFPLSGDVATNTAMQKLQYSKYGHNQVFGRKIVALMRRNARTFNLAVPHDPDNIISAQELGISLQEMSGLRWLFGSAGMSFDAKAVDFMARFQADPKAPFLTYEEIGRMIEVMVNTANRKSFGGEVKALKNSPKVQQWLAPLMHWNVRQISEWISSLSVPVEGLAAVNSVTDMKKVQLAQWTTTALGAILSMALPGALSGMRDDEIGRAIRRWAYGVISQNKQPWEHDTGGQWAQGHARYSMENVPFIAWIANLFLTQNTPTRSSMEPGLIMVKKITEASMAVQNLWMTWDVPEFGLDLVQAFAPQDVRAATRWLPSRTGKIQRTNAIALIKRYAPKDMVRPWFKGGNPNQTELSEYGPKMWNAAYNEDMPKLKEAYDEAVAVAKKMGKKEPEKSIEQMFMGGNPYSAALKGHLTVQQSKKMLEDMGEGAAAQLRGWEKAFADAAVFLGMNAPNLLMEEKSEPDEPWQPRDPSKLRRYEETVKLRDLMRN